MNTKKIDRVRLLRIPSYYTLSSIMSVVILQHELGERVLYTIYKGLLWVWRTVIIGARDYIYENNKSIFLFIYGTYNYRKDHEKTFTDFTDRFDDSDRLRACAPEKRVFHGFGLIKYLMLSFVWFFQFVFSGVSIRDTLCALPYVVMCHYLNKKLLKLPTNKYKFVVTYCDVSPDENCMIQFFKNLNITTMTLQHGIFEKKPNPRSASETGFELYDSISDWYLAWNEYTVNEAVSLGMSRERVIPLGIPKYINYTAPEHPTASNNRIFGVILHNMASDKHNRQMIDIANQIAEKYDLQFILRYHPSLKGNEYNSICGPRYIGNNDIKTSINQYAESVCFTIVSNSSVFVELILMRHPVYRKIVTSYDTYSKVKPFSFDTLSDFDSIYQDDEGNKEKEKQVFDLLCNTYDIYENYRQFFNGKLN